MKAACCNLEENAGAELDKNTKIFINWVKKERVFLIYMFYKLRKILQ